jgi:hypothetical protein
MSTFAIEICPLGTQPRPRIQYLQLCFTKQQAWDGLSTQTQTRTLQVMISGDGVSWWGEREWGSERENTFRFEGFPTRWEPDLFSTGEGARVCRRTSIGERERERKEFREKLKRWRGERERRVLKFFEMAGSFTSRWCWKILTVKLSF